MVTFLFDKIVEVKRYSKTLGEYNRPKQELVLVGTYDCHVTDGSSNTSQLQPQKEKYHRWKLIYSSRGRHTKGGYTLCV